MSDTTKGLVSIVVPVYNHEQYVLQCIESILAQDYPAVELIVINDGSTDNSDSIINSYLEAHPGAFHYVCKTNEGLVKTLNHGLAMANGEFFCELASDDLLMPGSISRRVAYLRSHPEVDAVFADNILLKDNAPTGDRFYGGYKSGTGFSSSRHTIKDLLTKKARYHIPTGMFRTAHFRDFGGFGPDFHFFEDISIRYLYPLVARIEFMDEPVMYYRIHDANVSKTRKLVALQEKILGLEKLLARPEQGDYMQLARDILFRSYLRLAGLLIKQHDKKQAREALARAQAISKFSPKLWLLKLKLGF